MNTWAETKAETNLQKAMLLLLEMRKTKMSHATLTTADKNFEK